MNKEKTIKKLYKKIFDTYLNDKDLDNLPIYDMAYSIETYYRGLGLDIDNIDDVINHDALPLITDLHNTQIFDYNLSNHKAISNDIPF